MTGKKKSITLIGGGRAQNPEKAEKALASKQCDMIFIGHGLLAQPDLVNLVAEGREDEIRPCIGCGHCINHQLQHGSRAICSGNAVLARGDNDYSIKPAEIKKHVVVIGAGVAGVECARIAAMRGHDVEIFEASSEVGGQMKLAGLPPFKQHLQLMKPYLERQIELKGVKLHLNHKVSAEEIEKMNPDVVVCATGVKPAKLPIEGAERAINAKQVLEGSKTGKNVVVIGGGSIGCETAEFLAKQGKKVAIVEMLDNLAGNTGKTAQTILLGHLKGMKVKIHTESKVEKITASNVICKSKDDSTFELKADTVVLAIGDKPDTELFDSLQGKVSELYNIGDSNGGGIIPNAVFEGYTLANKI